MVGMITGRHWSRHKSAGIPLRRSFFKDAIDHYEMKSPVKVLNSWGGLGLGSIEIALQHLDGQ